MAQWYPTREILRFGLGLVTKEKTMMYLGGYGHTNMCVDAYAIGCGVLATIEQ